MTEQTVSVDILIDNLANDLSRIYDLQHAISVSRSYLDVAAEVMREGRPNLANIYIKKARNVLDSAISV